MADKLSYEDKVGIVPKETHINQIWDDDMNELKLKFNNNANLIDANTAKSNANETAIGNIPTQPYSEIQMQTRATPPPYSPGVMWFDGVNWNKYDNVPGTSLQDGKEVVLDVMNDNGNPLNNFTVIRYDSQSGGVPTVIRAQADTVANATGVAVMTHTLAVGSVGKAVFIGTASGDTSAWNEGDTLYLSSTNPGELTNDEQPIINKIGRVLVKAAGDSGLILVAPTGVINPTAIGQVFGENEVQTLTTTPQPLAVYTDTPFGLNITVNQTGTTPYSATMKPATVGVSGFYEVTFSISLSSPSNLVYNFEVYVNGAASGISAKIDLSNNNIDAGSCAFSAITQETIEDTEEIEIYGFTDSGTGIIDPDSVVFNMKRIGNV